MKWNGGNLEEQARGCSEQRDNSDGRDVPAIAGDLR